MTTFAQLSARLQNFLRGWLLVLGLKEGLVECATVCIKSAVILQKGIPTKKDLRRHLKFAHEKDISKKKQCDNCNVPFFGIGKNHLKISHIVDCYLCVETKIHCNSNQKKQDVEAKINSI